MSITKNQSRFDILPDDAGDPFETQKKSKKKKKEGGSGDVKKASKGNVNSDKKQLQNLAFGSASEGKKKKNQNQNQNQQNGNSSSSKDGVPGAKEQKNGNIRERPKGITDEQWEQWQKRDEDIMDETYASDLQAALLQSKLDFDTEQKNKPVAKGKKKKPVAVSLTDFQARLNEGGTSTATQISSVMNGGGNVPVYPPQYDDDDLVERFRQEARLELERERRKAIEKQLLMSRQPPPPIQRPVPGQPSPPRAASTPSDEKDLLISRLTDENLRLKSEVDLLKDKVKTINNYLQAAHEVKDKAKLIYDMENMTKANNDLHEELRQVHSQLEQEKSRSSAAMLELRRLLENRRRTNTEGSNP